MTRARGAAPLLLVPGPAWANTCATSRPDWDGAPVTSWQEAVFLFSTLPALALIVATLLAIRVRHQWGALVVVVLWSLLVTAVTMVDPGGTLKSGAAQGCVGSPVLFIALVAAICAGTIIYTAPRKMRRN